MERLADALGRALGRKFAQTPSQEVSGGSTHRCVRWDTDRGAVFVKIAPAAEGGMLEAEAAGLREISGAGALRVPQVLALEVVDPDAALVLEWIDFGPPTSCSEALLGRQLAAMHRVFGARFGWHRDNVIGRTLQRNDPSDDWAVFFGERRLGFQLDLAERNGLDSRVITRGRRVVESCHRLFAGHRPHPSLLHGDLWGGNWAVERASGAPVIFDPAVYYGDREADLAMTRLFGGFGAAFYAAYLEAWPLEAGADTRRTLYDLYHVLNHYNLFGGGYAVRAARMIDRLIDP